MDDLALGTRACAEFGADLIKTVFVEDFEKIAKTAGIPVLALGGGTFDKPSEAFAQAKKPWPREPRGSYMAGTSSARKTPSPTSTASSLS